MKKLMTILAVISIASTANAAATMDYTATDLGGGLRGYTFTVHGNDGQSKSFGTQNLVFTAKTGVTINQVLVQQDPPAGDWHVNDESTATTWNGWYGYTKNLDTWVFDGWPDYLPGGTDVTGDTSVTLNLGTGTTNYYEDKVLLYLVADGAVDWSGKIARAGTNYDTSGTAVPEPATMLLLALGGSAVLRKRRRKQTSIPKQ